MGFQKKTAGLLLAAFASIGTWNSYAQTPPEAPVNAPASSSALRHANALHLAYIASPSETINSESRNGLTVLAEQMGQKTAVVLNGVVGLDIEKDEIAFYPFIYWPVTANTPPLSEKAQRKVQNFINAGGTIVFDTGYVTGSATNALGTMLGNVVIKPLIPMDKNHTLTKSFYLVADLKGGRNGSIWVEAPGAQGNNTVSSVIIGEKMWARSWVNLIGYTGKDAEKDQVLRSGINMVIYALTGSYKEDQIHVPSILERLQK